MNLDQMLYDVDASCEQLGNIGRVKFYELVKSGELKTVKIGRRRFVSREALETFVASLSNE